MVLREREDQTEPRRYMSHPALRYSALQRYCDKRVTRSGVPLSRRPGVPNFRLFWSRPHALSESDAPITSLPAFTDG